MATQDADYQSIPQDELLARAANDRSFVGLQFAAGLTFDDIDLTESRFERCLFQVPTIRSADFSNAQFSDCKFEPTRFANCRFAKARLQGCVLFDAGKKKGCAFAFCDLQAAEVRKCNFATTSFDRCDLYNFSALECSFRGAQFHQSTFTKAISRRSVLTKAVFDKCNISFADLSGLSLPNCEFLSCKFSEASFIDTDLSGSTMLACDLDRVAWDRARLKKADLRGSNLAGLNLTVVTDYAGLQISESEQTEVLKQLGIDVSPCT